MRRSLVALLTFCMAAASLPVPAPAAPDRTLENLKGSVGYQLTATAAAQPVAPQATISLADSAYAVTGPNSMAAIGLPDSSRVLVGQSSKVQLVSFTQTDVANASFVLVPPSRTRFQVLHPNGARANYTFQTPLGQIAVRGTVGDISATATDLQVNVYDVSNPSLPVLVTLTNGQVISLGKGDVLRATLGAGGAIQVERSNVATPTYQPFVEFGLPQNAQELGLIGTQTAAAAVATSSAAVDPIWALILPVIATPIVIGANNSIRSHSQSNGPGSTTVPVTTQSAGRHSRHVLFRFFFPIPIP